MRLNRRNFTAAGRSAPEGRQTGALRCYTPAAMPTCIYCLESKPKTAFLKAEHVIPESFGGFRDNLTLHEVVCDDCNQFFGNDVELYLARDTPDGLNRFLIGGKNHREFHSLGKGSLLERRVKSDFLKGAFVAHGERPQKFVLLPQIGFGKSKTGPCKWFTVDQLPTREELQTLLGDGHRHVQFCEIDDPTPVLAELYERGALVSDSAAQLT